MRLEASSLLNLANATYENRAVHRLHAVLLFVVCGLVSGCDTAREKIERFEQGTRPDQPLPEVPPAPLGPGETPPPPRVVLLCVPGLGSELVARGIDEEFLPNLRRLKADGVLVLDTPAAGSAVSACASLFFGTNPGEHGIAAVPADALGYVQSASTLGAAMQDAPSEFAAARVVVPTPRIANGARSTVFDVLGDAGVRSLVLRAPLAFDATSNHVRRLASGATPGLDDAAGPTLFVEGLEAAERVAANGTRIVPAPVATRDVSEDVFSLEVLGPARWDASAQRASAQIELRLSWDRARGTVRTSDTGRKGLPIRAGRWTGPVRLRFSLGDGFDVFARTRLYLKPLGTKSMQLFVAAPELDPTGLPWRPTSSPRELAGVFDQRIGGLPMSTSPFLAGPIADGVLDVRDAVALLEQQAKAERALLMTSVVERDTECVVHWLDLVEQFARLGPGASDAQQRLQVELFGKRVRRWRLIDAAAAELDQIVGHAMSAAVSGELGPETTVIVWAPYGGLPGERKAGFFGMTRIVDGEVQPPLPEDVTATVVRLLGKTQPTTMTGRALDVGVRMNRFPLSEVSARLEAEPEPDAEDE